MLRVKIEIPSNHPCELRFTEYEYVKPAGASDTDIHYYTVSHRLETPPNFAATNKFTIYTERKYDVSQTIKNTDIKDAKGTFREGKFADGTFESIHVTNSTTFRYACQRRRILYNADNVRNHKNSEKQVLPFYLINAKNIDELNKSVKIILDFGNNTYLSNTVTIELWLNVYVDDK